VSRSWNIENEHLDLRAFRRIAETLARRCRNVLADAVFAAQKRKRRPKAASS
jgi:hypothetical protein